MLIAIKIGRDGVLVIGSAQACGGFCGPDRRPAWAAWFGAVAPVLIEINVEVKRFGHPASQRRVGLPDLVRAVPDVTAAKPPGGSGCAFLLFGTSSNHVQEITVPQFACLLALSLLAACAEMRPDPVASPRLDSGITSNNGGGQRALGDIPNVGVTTRVGTVR